VAITVADEETGEELFVLDAGPRQYRVVIAKVAPERSLKVTFLKEEQERHGGHRCVSVPVGERPGRSLVQS
jgi:hypothetical protein